MMKLKSGLLCGLMTLTIVCSGCETCSLKDIANPHLGVYECTQADLSGKDYLEYFDYIHLELKPEGEFLLHYRGKEGEPKEETGKYEYDRKSGMLTILGKGTFQREFSLKEGILTISVPIGEQTLTLTFEQK